jgi:2-keto-4-pentenoate hydratase/2-oxohepta-3-ene-1,7-dioic acid hydratase in catechol pathway
MRKVLMLTEAELRTLADTGTEAMKLESVDLLSPIARPPHIYALAGNFTPGGRNAIAEDATPWIFPKSTYDVSGPNDDIVLWDLGVDVVEEIELAIIIGRPGRNVPREDALRHVAGYTVCNDVSARKLDLRADRRPHKFDAFFDWLTGKLFDGYAVLGPEIVTQAELPDPRGLAMRTRVNGEVRVEGNTSSMVFGVDEVVAFVSRVAELTPGDVIMTGMPHTGRPEVFLKPGDTIEGEIDRVGVLRNKAVGPKEVKDGTTR